MSKPEKRNDAEIPQELDDPLAELARIVSSGSLFGDVKPLNNDRMAEPNPAPAPGNTAPAKSQGQIAQVEPEDTREEQNLENLEELLGAELEANLLGEFQEELEETPLIAETRQAKTEYEKQDAESDTLEDELFEAFSSVVSSEERPPAETHSPIPLKPENNEEALSAVEAALLSGFEERVEEDPIAVPVEAQVVEASDRGPSDIPEDDPIAAFLQEEIEKAHQDLEAESVTGPATLNAPQPVPPKAAHPTERRVEEQATEALEAALLLDSFEEEPHSDEGRVLLASGKEPNLASLDDRHLPSKREVSSSPEIDFGAFESDLKLDASPKAQTKLNAPVDVMDAYSDHINSRGSEADDFQVDEHFDFDAASAPDNSGRNRARGIAAIVGVLVLTLIGSVAYLLYGFATDYNSPVVVAADDGPVKVRPDDPGGKVIPNQDNAVYERLANSADTSDDSVLLRDNSAATLPVSPNPEARDESQGSVSATTPNLGPKTVRTVVIRPDGTPVFPENEAGADPRPGVDLPAAIVPQTSADPTPVENETTPESLALRGSQPNEVVPAPNNPTEEGASPDTLQETQQDLQPESQVASLPPVPRPNLFANRTSGSQIVTNTRPTSAASEPTVPRLEANQPSITPSGSAPPITGGGDFLVQLSSQRTEAQAQTTFNNLSRRFDILSGYAPNIRRVDLGERGVFHRVRVGPFASAEANRLCNELKQRGGDCILARN